MQNTFIYREQLQRNASEGHYYLRIDMDHLVNFDENLSTMVRTRPAECMPAFEKAVQ